MIFLLALAPVLVGFALLSLLADLLDKRALRREIARAHQPRPFDRERETA